ncbi:MAG: acyl-CoA thioesterase [Ferruginibacter sp.]|nr:acyl-CoA thioesterase [Ferruginibacter sp.]
MTAFEIHPEIRWSDLDPNNHLRHSVYYDYGASCRIAFLHASGVTADEMGKHNIGPIIFREECIFRKEIRFGDQLMINVKLVKSLKDNSRWTMKHELWKNSKILAAVITVDGAWLDTSLRKLAKPPLLFSAAFDTLPKADDFITSETK